MTSAAMPNATAAPTEESQIADIVVLGGGLAGHAAAIEAARAGCSVLLVEKLDQVGGSTVLSGGSIAFAGTEEQAAEGVQDDNERLRGDLIESAGRAECRELIDTYVANQLAGYRFLKDLGIRFGPMQSAARQSVPRSHPTDPRAMIERLAEVLRTFAHATTLLSTRALRLERNSAGRVDAVLAERAGRRVRLGARRGIVLATGGFSRDRELLNLFAPRLERSMLTGGAGSTGDGTRMALAQGGLLADLDILLPTFGCLYEDTPSEPNTILLPMYKGGIAVNRFGRRFCNESLPYKRIGELALDQDEARGFQVFDEAVMEKSALQPKTYDFRRAKGLGRVLAGPTLADLAKKMDVDAGILEETVRTYNEGIARGEDRAFGRRTLVHTQGKPFPLVKPPYYAYPSATFLAGTFGGIRVTGQMEVLDVWHAPIPGLYAAGEVTGGLHGRSYMTGTALGKALIFGRLAAKHAAATA